MSQVLFCNVQNSHDENDIEARSRIKTEVEMDPLDLVKKEPLDPYDNAQNENIDYFSHNQDKYKFLRVDIKEERDRFNGESK
jgi:hypothetical protein